MFVEYLISISFIAGFILFWELLKPRPFRTLVETSRDDIAYIRETGRGNIFRTAGRIVSAPFVGLAYVIAVPFVFAYAIFLAAMGGLLTAVGKEAAFGWRPAESYLAGRKKEKDQGEKKTDEME
ncbi:MAG: hypothetical protein P8Z71_07310 [Candidatus Sulfobium sp.]